MTHTETPTHEADRQGGATTTKVANRVGKVFAAVAIVRAVIDGIVRALTRVWPGRRRRAAA
jgi:hypothetical protein